MKKIYINPSIDFIQIECSQIMAVSIIDGADADDSEVLTKENDDWDTWEVLTKENNNWEIWAN